MFVKKIYKNGVIMYDIEDVITRTLMVPICLY